jgi:hypothetical protein
MSIESKVIVFAGISSGTIGSMLISNKDDPCSQAREMYLVGLGFDLFSAYCRGA